ncbi:MAG: hypothetical protein HFJ75_05275 [Eggerthellaceae bacterium]|nr:hypothetical protein [Eggerthellaceae bacterium]
MCGYACIRCGQCGKKFAPLPQAGTCPRCGAPNDPDAGVCADCGRALPPRPGAAAHPDPVARTPRTH